MSDNTAPENLASTVEPATEPAGQTAFVPEPAEPITTDVAAGSTVAAPAPAAPRLAASSPAPAPAPAAPAFTAISVDERAYQQYQNLSKAVLDSADIATRSAEAAMSVSSQLKQATHDFRELTDAGHKKARLLLAIAGGVMVVCTLFYLVMGVRMVSRINKLDAMVEALGKRVIELNTAMESIEGVNRGMQELAAKHGELTKAQSEIEGRIDAQLKQSESLVQKVPGETAKQVAASSDTLLKQVQGLNSRMQSQANAVQSLGNEVKALKGSVGNVDGLRRDVETLVTLQKERYLEALQKNNANASAQRERNLQYPRVSPAKPGEAAAGSAPGPVVTPPAKP